MKRLWLGAAMVAMVAAGCASDNDDASGASPTTASEGLQARLLSTEDLPDGFDRVSAGERGPSEPDPGSDTSQFCAEIDQHGRNFPGERVAEADFERGPASATVFVNQQVTRYATSADAARAFENFEKALLMCSSVTKTDADGTMAGSFTPVEFVEAGDETLATAFSATQTVDDDSASISGHFVALRAQRYVVLFSALGSVDTLTKSECEAITKRIVAKL